MSPAAQTTIHPGAVVEDGAELGARVTIGPFCHVAAGARLGDDVHLVSGVTVLGGTTLGDGGVVYPGAVLGGPPQNVKHKGGPTALNIGRNCIIREGVTMHRGSDSSRGSTDVGDNGHFLAFCHVGHDSVVGNHVTLSNQVSLGGHCEIGDHVLIGGHSAVHQFVRMGHHSFLTAMSGAGGDIIPYGLVAGRNGKLQGFNVIGMKRSGMTRAELQALRALYRTLFAAETPFAENFARASAQPSEYASVRDIIAFLSERGHRHLCVPAVGRAEIEDDDAA
jgi:UDP-N-acetylglucosamine acyltransferase